MVNSGAIRIFTDLFFGDSGKGTMVDWYTRLSGIKAVIRTSGGSQSAHHVETPEGVIHCFRQFGSGALIDGVKTILTRYALINPYNLSIETRKLIDCGLDNPLSELIVSENCLVITPFHVIMNKVLEASRGKNRYGSVGMGVGQAIQESREYPEDAIYAGDLKYNAILHARLMRARYRTIRQAEEIVRQIQDNGFIQSRLSILRGMDVARFVDFYLDFALNTNVRILPDTALGEIISREKSLVFEPTQGVLLDPDFGFWPHVTKTNTTSRNARRLLSELKLRSEISETGIIRAYATRHGAGPFVTEVRKLGELITDKNNIAHDWQGKMRYGWLDLVALRHALAANNGVDDLAVTCLDQLSGFPEIKVCTSYEYLGSDMENLSHFFEWEYFGGRRIKVLRFKPLCRGDRSGRLAGLLFACRPLEFMEFPGWQKDISAIKSFSGLPLAAQNYVRSLEEMIGVKISIISVGPTWTHKINL